MKRLSGLFKRLLAATVRFPRITVAVGVFLLIALIWIGGPFVSIVRVETRLFLIVGVLFFWSVFLLLDRYRAERGARLLEESLHRQVQTAAVRPDRREEIEALGRQFEKAVASLKQSKLGRGGGWGGKGSAALYALPWYMLIGPPASGKSTALQHSGLQFPSLGRTGRGVQGIGGTRNCDWWFTNEAVLLDTAGRYVTEEEDREEWFGFLDLLRKYRKGKPINGVLVMMNLADLLDASEEKIEWHAKTIRERIDELTGRLGIVFPVYLVFTKCDLIRGFVEFFEDLSRTERDQLWGATFPKDLPAKSSPGELFASEFDLLLTALQARRIDRLSGARGPQKVREVYGFPLQMTSGREKLTRFVETLFERNAYHENPIFRGFYFTSGTQEGTPIDRILTAVSGALGLSEAMGESFGGAKETKSYFIKNLLTEVIFPDQALAGFSTAMTRRKDYFRLGVFLGAIVFLLISLTGFSFSFIGNRVRIGSIQSAAESAAEIDLRDEQAFAKNVAALERLREEVERMRSDEEKGVPFRLRGGLYRGATLYPPARDLYFRKFGQVILAPGRTVVEADLRRFVINPRRLPEGRDDDYYYSLLKLYLMLSDPTHFDAAFVETRLEKIWKERLLEKYGEKKIPLGLPEWVVKQISFYSRYPRRDETFPPLFDPTLVRQTREVLREIPVADRLYARIRREGLEKLEEVSRPYTLKSALGGGMSDLLTEGYAIPPLFTEAGWKGAFRQASERILNETATEEEEWVLGVSAAKRDQVETEIEKRYFDEYARYWRSFLDSTRIRPVEGLADAERILKALSQEDSPVGIFLSEVDKNTYLNKEIALETGLAESTLERVKKGLGIQRPGESAAPSLQPTPVAFRFQSLHQFVVSNDPKKETPLAHYVGEVRRVHDAIRTMIESGGGAGIDAKAAAAGKGDIFQAQRNTERLLQTLDPELRTAVGPILTEPFRIALSGVTGSALADLNRRWRKEVYEPCREGIVERYPFQKGGEDAMLADVSELLHPQEGVLWKFYEKNVKSFVEEGPDRWEVRKGPGALPLSAEFLESLRKARFISESLFPRGSAEVKIPFELYPYPSPGVSEIVITADGKELRYRNEPQEWREWAWPGASGAAAGASLQVQVGGTKQVQQYSGRWGFFKLLAAGQITPISPTLYRIEWEFGGAKGEGTHRTEGSAVVTQRRVKIRFDLRAQSVKNPFKPDLFLEFRCPSRVG